MSAKTPVTVASTSGNTIAVTKKIRDDLFLRNVGTRTFIGFNEPAIYGVGVFIEDGEVLILNGWRASAAIYFVTNTGLASTVYVDD